MNILKLIACTSLSTIITFSCTAPDNKLTGIWQLTDSDGRGKNFFALSSFPYPYREHGHKVYFSDSLFYNPFNKQNGLPFEEPYQHRRNILHINGIGQVKVGRLDSVLVLSKDECTLTFIKHPPLETLAEHSVSEIDFFVRDGENVLIDSLSLIRANGKEHIFRIAESIELNSLNKTFDLTALDVYQYHVGIKLFDGRAFQITSFGNQLETPFEVSLLIKYLLYEFMLMKRE